MTELETLEREIRQLWEDGMIPGFVVVTRAAIPGTVGVVPAEARVPAGYPQPGRELMPLVMGCMERRRDLWIHPRDWADALEDLGSGCEARFRGQLRRDRGGLRVFGLPIVLADGSAAL